MLRISRLVIPCILALAVTVGGLAGCGKPSFQDQRTHVVQFLTQFNQAGNNFNDSLVAADIGGKLNRGNLVEVSSALNTLVQLCEGYKQRVNELSLSSDVPELTELKSAELTAVNKILYLFQGLRSAIQAGNSVEVQRVALQITQLSSDTDINKPKQLEESLLAKYNIPDTEVNYHRK